MATDNTTTVGVTVHGTLEAWSEEPGCGPWGRTQTAELQTWPSGGLAGGLNATIEVGPLAIRVMVGTDNSAEIVVTCGDEQVLNWEREDGARDHTANPQ